MDNDKKYLDIYNLFKDNYYLTLPNIKYLFPDYDGNITEDVIQKIRQIIDFKDEDMQDLQTAQPAQPAQNEQNEQEEKKGIKVSITPGLDITVADSIESALISAGVDVQSVKEQESVMFNEMKKMVNKMKSYNEKSFIFKFDIKDGYLRLDIYKDANVRLDTRYKIPMPNSQIISRGSAFNLINELLLNLRTELATSGLKEYGLTFTSSTKDIKMFVKKYCRKVYCREDVPTTIKEAITKIVQKGVPLIKD